MKAHSDQGSISIFRAEYEKIVIPTIMDLNGRVLDVGCSSGIYKDIFQKCYIGIDLSNIEFPINNDRNQFIVGSGYHLPFKEESFEFVLCNGVLEHTENPERVIIEISRVLKEGKTAIISVPTPSGLRWESHPKFRGYTISELESLIKSNQLEITNFRMGGGILAQIIYIFENLIKKASNENTQKDNEKRWDPKLKNSQAKTLIKFRRFIVNLVSTFEIRSGLNNVYSQGLYVWTRKKRILSK